MTPTHVDPTIESIARICHEANRAYCASIGDNSQFPWDAAPIWQRESAIRGVVFAMQNPTAPPSAKHEAWVTDKVNEGWTYGPVKDPEQKTHPCIVPYSMLPKAQQEKDALFKAIVNAMAPAEPETMVAQTKRWRRDLDVILQEMKDKEDELYEEHARLLGAPRREATDLQQARTVAICRLKEVIMWCGMILKGLGTANPYPHSYDPSSPVVEKTADNLKL